MRKLIFCPLIFCIFAGCAETNERAGGGYKGFPVKLQLQDQESMPVKVEAKDKKPIPVEVQWQGGEGKTVKVEVKSNEVLPVKLDLRGQEAFAVKMKLSWVTFLFIATFAAAILIVVVITCFVVIRAACSVKAVSQSVDAIKKAQQRRETELSGSENG
jgi:hypothetical protein